MRMGRRAGPKDKTMIIRIVYALLALIAAFLLWRYSTRTLFSVAGLIVALVLISLLAIVLSNFPKPQ